jgi:hypothetical protein
LGANGWRPFRTILRLYSTTEAGIGKSWMPGKIN